MELKPCIVDQGTLGVTDSLLKGKSHSEVGVQLLHVLLREVSVVQSIDSMLRFPE